MRNLKRLATSLVAIVFVIAFSSCEKQPAADLQQDVVFSINNVTNSLKKGTVNGINPSDSEFVIPNCSDEAPAYVMVGMDGNDPVKLDVLSGLNDGTETVVMKLDADVEHTINSFMVYSSDGSLIWAAPMNNSYYAQLWDLDGLVKKFTVEAFKKNAITIDVLCWEEYSYEEFGFNWFDFQGVTIKTMCFFGDICTKFYDDFYNFPGSPYNRGDGVDRGYDMPAIFKVLIKTADGVVINDQTMNSNASYYGEGSPLCIEYPDFGDTQDNYFFEIYLAYPDGSYNLVYTSDMFAAEDDQSAITGEDGVFDFVVGNCSAEDGSANIVLPAYLFLPDTGHVMIEPTQNTGVTYEYFDVELLGSSWNNSLFPDELAEGNVLGAYCGDLFSYINGGNAEYDVNIYSSLEPTTMPSLYNGYPWGALNWLANQQQAITNNQVDGKILQAIVWFIIHRDQAVDSNGNSHSASELFNRVLSSSGLSTAQVTGAKNVADYALDNMSGFVPQTGQYSIVLFDPIEDNNTAGTANIQLVLVRVDP